MIFFYDRDLSPEPSASSGQDDKVVVTTLNQGIRPPAGVAPRSYTFSMATNRSLPQDLMPTLILFFDTKTAQDIGDLLIYRYDDNAEAADRWQPIPTYVLAGAAYAAAPLRNGAPDSAARSAGAAPAFNSAAGLLGGSSQLIERYRLCLVRPSVVASAR